MTEFVLPKITKRLLIYRNILIHFLLCSAAWIFIPSFKLKLRVIILLFALCAFFCVYLTVYLKNYRVILNKNSITVKSGIVFWKEKILPDKARLYSVSFSLPLDRRFDIESIAFFAVKGTLLILPLKKEDIKRIKENIL